MCSSYSEANFATENFNFIILLLYEKSNFFVFDCALFFGCKEHTELQNVIEEPTVSYDGVMLQNTLDVIKSMIVDDPTMINFIDASIVKEKDYLEDRVLFSDLFSDNTNFDTQQKSMIDANNFYDVVSY